MSKPCLRLIIQSSMFRIEYDITFRILPSGAAQLSVKEPKHMNILSQLSIHNKAPAAWETQMKNLCTLAVDKLEKNDQFELDIHMELGCHNGTYYLSSSIEDSSIEECNENDGPTEEAIVAKHIHTLLGDLELMVNEANSTTQQLMRLIRASIEDLCNEIYCEDAIPPLSPATNNSQEDFQ